MGRDNFYILLDISITPPEKNAGVIEKAIKKKQAEWSQLRNHPTKGRSAQLYLGLIPEIRKVMADQASRKAEASEARQIIANTEKEKYKSLDEAIGILSSKGHITEKEIAALAKRFSFASDPEIRSRIKAPIVKDKKKKKRKAPLEATIAKKISGALDIVEKSTLYEFLDRSPSSSLKCLLDATREKDAEIRKVSHKDAVITASGELTGHCLNVFKTEDKRAAYDETRARQRLVDLDGAIGMAGVSGVVTPQAYDQLVAKATNLGLGKDDAGEYILEYCKKKKWAVQVPTALSVDKMEPCGVCGVMNPPGLKNCTSCGRALRIDCPKCGKTSPSTVRVCGGCGFFLGDMPNAERLINRARLALADKDLGLAMSLFQKAEIYWPGHPDIDDGKQRIREYERNVARAARELHDAINKRLYYEARMLLSRLGSMEPNHPDLSLKGSVDQRIKVSETWVRKARSARTANEAIDAYSSALSECADCRDAREGLAKSPPDPPASLKAADGHRSISFQWPPSSARGEILYRLVRKAESQPLNSKDGDIVAETAQTVVDDAAAEAGRIYFYAVYAVRGEIASRRGPVAGPVLRTADVRDIQTTPGDARLHITWKAPARASRVEIRIKENGVPTARGDGRKVGASRMDGVDITGLRNDVLHGIRITAIYTGPGGKRIAAPGVVMRATPCSPPSPVMDLSIQKRGKTIVMKWTPPPKGSVVLVRSDHPFPHSPGEIIQAGQTSRLGAPVPVLGRGDAQWAMNVQGVVHILPLVVSGDMAVVGKSGSITSIDDVSNLKGEVNSGRLYLEWQWPQGARRVLVAHGHDAHPSSPEDSSAGGEIVTREIYDRDSAYVIRKPLKRDYCFTVFVMGGEGDGTIYSTGARCLVPNAGIREILYEIKVSKSLFGKIKSARVVLMNHGDSVQMPETVLVKKTGRLPIRRSDGAIICRIKPFHLEEARPALFDISVKELSRNTYAKLYFKEGDNALKYRLMAPGKEKLRLF